MALVQFTRMLEKKVKSRDRGDLRAFAYANVGPVWVRAEQIVAITSFNGPIFMDDDHTVDGNVTELILAGTSEPMLIAEPVHEVVAAVE